MRYAIFLKEINLSIFSFFSYMRNLNDLINAAHEIGLLKKDVAKFSHVLRDFRNYIHPYQQMSERFFPDENTAKICMQVMKGALLQISRYRIA